MRNYLTLALALLWFPAFAQTSTQVRYVETLADLVARQPVGFESVLVAGRSTPGDWGPARLFYATNAVPGGSTNIAHSFASASASRWWSSLDASAEKQDVRWWGAKGDGSTDDTYSITNAIDYLYQSGGGTVFFPNGKYVASSIGLKQKVNLLGNGVTFASLDFEDNPERLGASVIIMKPASTGPLLYNVPGAGQIYQPDQVLQDGSTNSAWSYQLWVRDLAFYGNAVNQTSDSADLVFLNGAWSIDLQNVSLVRPSGYTLRMRDCNVVNLQHVNMLGGNTRSKGWLLEQVADCNFVDVHVAQMAGPNVSLATVYFNKFDGLYQFGSGFFRVDGVRYWNTNFLSETVASNIITIPGDGHPFSTGDLVWFDKGLNSLTGVSSLYPYYVTKLSSNTFTVNQNYVLATNGVAAELTAGAGSIDVGIGNNVGLRIGAGSYLNTFNGVHVDENYDGGLVIAECDLNTINGFMSHRNYGTPGVHTPRPTSAVTFKGTSRFNNLIAANIYDATNGITFNPNSVSNRIIGTTFKDVLTNYVGGTGNFSEAVIDPQNGWILANQPSASPFMRALRPGVAGIDFALSGPGEGSSTLVVRDNNDADDIVRLLLDDGSEESGGGVILNLGGITYDSDDLVRPAFVSGTMPASGHLTDADAKTMTFTPSLGTGAGASAGFLWRLPVVGSSGTARQSTTSGMALSSTVLDIDVPLLTLNDASIQNASSVLRLIAANNVEVWSNGGGSREFSVTDAGIVFDGGRGFSFYGGSAITNIGTGLAISGGLLTATATGSGSITADLQSITNISSSATITNTVTGEDSALSVVDGSIGATQLGSITSAELASKVSDESGNGALIFAGGNIGAATATTPSANDNDTSVATTAYVQAEETALLAGANTWTGQNIYTNKMELRGGIDVTNYILRVMGPDAGGRIFPSTGKGLEFAFDATNNIGGTGGAGRGELQIYDRGAAQYGDFRFNSRVMGIYSSGTLVALVTNGLFDLTGQMKVSGAVTSGGTNLHTLPYTLDAAVKAEQLWQATNANLTTLSSAGSTGTGAFVRADSPTVTGTWAFDGMTIGTLTVTTNAYFTTQSPGDNSTNAATTAYVDAAVAAVGGGCFDPFNIANTLAFGSYEFVGNTVASAVIPWNSAAVSSGSTIQFTPTAAYPDPGQIAFRTASGTALNTGGIITAAADTLYFTNDWAFACSLFTTKTNGSMWRIGINSSQNSTVPTDQFSFTVTNNQCYPTAFSNTIVTLGTPYTLELNTAYTLKARATNQGGAHYQIWSGGDLVFSNDIATGLPWQRNISMGVLGLNSATENTNTVSFLRVGYFGWTNLVSR